MSDSPNRLRPVRDFLSARILVLSIVLTLIATGLSLWLPRRLGDMVDQFVAGDVQGLDILRPAGIYLGLALVSAAFSKWMRMVPMRWRSRIAHGLRIRLQGHLLSLDESQVRKKRVGDVMSRLQSDVAAVADMLAIGGHSMIRATFTLGIAFTLMYRRSPGLALLMSLLIPFIMVIGFVMLRSIRSRHLRVQEQLGLLTTYCQESFSGLRIVRGLGLESFRFKTFQGMNQDYIRRNLKLSRVEIMTWPLIQSGFVLGNVILLWAGGMRVIRGEISLGMLVEFQQYLMILQWPSLSVAWTMSLILRGRASLTRLQDVLAEEPPVTGGTQSADPSKAEVQPIVFDQVSLSLEGRPVLHDVSFRVEPGQMLGITGPTGSGKTLLLQMVLRRQDPDAGRIWFGDTDIRDMPLESLYRIFRIAAQEPVLFSMTLRENLVLADAEVSEEALQQALYLSALQHDLEQLPDGLETKIGERGVTLSGGQRQRSAIARALISDPPVLMLDDSLSAVDTSTESRILERLLPAVRGRTLMMVSHRYAALRHCDQVLVLREGRVEQAGSPADLMAQGGYFAELELRQRLQAQLEEGE